MPSESVEYAAPMVLNGGGPASRFGTVCLWREDPDRFAEEVAAADSLGYHMVCVGDSQSVYRELYVSLAVVARLTRRALVGPLVTNPVTRHPAVTASAIATIDELAGGRAILGIGTGDSAIRNLGEKAATLAHLRRYVTAVKGLLQGETVEWDGKPIHVSWIRRPVPIYLSAEGPKALELAGELADGICMHTGSTPEIVEESLGHLQVGAERAGRDASTIDVWAMLKAAIADTREEALSDVRMGLAGSAHHAFHFGVEGKHVPEVFHAPMTELVHRYDTRRHEVWNDANARISDELGLTDYLADRFGLVGTPEHCVDRVRALREAGLRQIVIPALGPNPLEMIRRFGQEVFSKFTSAA